VNIDKVCESVCALWKSDGCMWWHRLYGAQPLLPDGGNVVVLRRGAHESEERLDDDEACLQDERQQRHGSQQPYFETARARNRIDREVKVRRRVPHWRRQYSYAPTTNEEIGGTKRNWTLAERVMKECDGKATNRQASSTRDNTAWHK
jgi:hypothetical protein